MAGGTHEATIKIQARVDNAERELRKLEKQVSKLTKAQRNNTDKTKEGSAATVDYLAKVGLAANAIQQAWGALDQYSKRAVQATNVQRALTFSIDKARSATGGLVNDLDLMTAANKATQLGVVDNANDFARLAEVATKLGAAMGQDATSSVDDFATAMGRASPQIADNLGLQIRVGEANKAYAESIGKTVAELSDAEKKIAFQTELMKQAEEKAADLGTSYDTLGAKVQQLITWFENVSTEALKLDQHFADLGTEINAVIGTEQTDQYIGSWQQFWDVMSLGSTAAIRNFGELDQVIQDALSGTNTIDRVVTESIKLQRKQADEQQQNLNAEADRRNELQRQEWLKQRAEEEGLDEESRLKAWKARNRKGGKRKKVAGNYDFNADFSGAVAAEATRLESGRDYEDTLADYEAQRVAAEQELEVVSLIEDAERQRYERRLALLEVEKEAAEWRAENTLDGEERINAEMELAALQHEQKIEHLREEQRLIRETQKAEQERRKNIQEFSNAAVSAYGDIGSAAANAAAASGASAKQQEVITRVTEGGVLMAKAISEQVQAVMAFTSLNVPMGIAHQAAAAAGFANASIFLAGDLPGGARGGGGGGRGRARPTTSSPAANGPSYADSDVPLSSDEYARSRGGTTTRGGPGRTEAQGWQGGVTVNVNGMALGRPEDIGREVQNSLRAFQQSGGVI